MHLKVKFRAFFVTFGQLDQKVSLPLGISVPLPNFDTVLVNQRGVFLRASNQPIP